VTTRREGEKAGKLANGFLLGLLLVAGPGCAPAQASGAGDPSAREDRPSQAAGLQDYVVLIASEVTDEIATVRFRGDSGWVERTDLTGFNPGEPDGPHGLGVSPRGDAYYVSIAHGAPFGYLFKHDLATGRVLANVELGLFPASLQVSPDGHYVYVANFNLHGDMVPSAISIVSTAEMLEVARVETCAMPHGSRFNAAGTRHYSTCMMDEALVEIDATNFTVARHFMLTKGVERGMVGAPQEARGERREVDHSGHGAVAPAAGNVKCSPTWAAPSPDGRSVYVACNASSDIVEVDVATWTMKRRIPAGNGVYNLALTGDGSKLIATNKRDQSVSVFDVASGRELGRVQTLRRVVHGIAISADDRYAFISVEGYGSEPGTLEMIDLAAVKRVASVDVGQMAGGIDIVPAGNR
jgi:DNA-binding beta-propeller fold protein YncE